MSFSTRVTLAFLAFGGAAAAALALAAPAQAADPVFNPQPISNILAPGTTSVDLSVSTASATTCGYAIGVDKAYGQMTPFAQTGATTHRTTVALNPDPKLVNDVYVRCAVQPAFALTLKYRVRADASPRYPRIGNLWGWGEWKWDAGKSLAEMARVDLWMGADVYDLGTLPTYRSDFQQLRTLNPNVLILASINAVEPYTSTIPEGYYLHDVNGQRIEVWPGSYRLNLTKPEVADYQAGFAYQRIAEAGFIHDGLFIDNVFLSQSWQTQDIYGNPVQIDADENGLADDPTTFDAAWRAGVLREIEGIRALMPDIILSGHALEIEEPRIAATFNGDSFGFSSANIIEGEETFAEVQQRYNAWMTQARAPQVVMFEGSPIDLFAYGYDYEPLSKATTSGAAFARDFYPWMRFALGLSLLNDGYYAYEWGDTWHGNAWWYDEYDLDLGAPSGPAMIIPVAGFTPGPNLALNPGFEDATLAPWTSWVDSANGYAATIARDTASPGAGTASARITVTQAGGEAYRVDFNQPNRSLTAGTAYEIRFLARASTTRQLTVGVTKGVPDWDNYGLWRTITLSTTWQEYVLPFEATATAGDARLQFLAGETTGSLWLDDVRLTRRAPDVWRRNFGAGAVLVNGTAQAQTIAVGGGLRRFTSAQAPRDQRILDDAAGFTTPVGSWSATTLDSGEWKASGPFFHSFGTTAHRLASGAGEAVWTIPVAATDTYTVSVWYPAAPEAGTWTTAATYDLLVNGSPVATRTLNQRTAGDTWQTIGSASLSAGASVTLRLTCTGPCVADAVYVESAARYNDGTVASTITLQPFDAIVLVRDLTRRVYLPHVKR
ncbi:MAG: carbohydrate binding domain-containing protein [Anaerolineales bacterium]|nr:carbohydrate binding domain-containing protein [Anaerolineales bacterium]